MKISWFNKKLELRKTNRGDKGIFTKSKINLGERVLVFGGYVLDMKELQYLEKNRKSSYSAIVKVSYQIDEDLIFSPTYYNQFSTAEYLNHSCEPNCGFDGPIRLVAMRNIKKDEEITMDYAMCITSNLFDMKCLCSKLNCRKKVTSNDWKNPDIQKKYKNYFQPYIQKKIKELK